MNSIPADEDEQSTGAAQKHLIIAPSWTDDATGAVYVHKDLVQAQAPWANEEHVSPVRVEEALGDVESWCEYIKRHASIEPDHSLLTWNQKGLRAVLDYPNRRQWVTAHPFVQTPEFRAWLSFANGGAHEQKKAVEFLEDHAPDIFEPAQGDLLNLMRQLTANAAATATVESREDGTADVSFARTASVSSGPNKALLPGEITIQIPVLRGHIEENGAIVRYKLVLKVRASVDPNAHLALRFTMPQAEVVLEQVYAERVASAKELLGDGYTILRAAD